MHSTNHLLLACLVLLCPSFAFGQQSKYKTIRFPSQDGLQLTGDLYAPHEGKQTPFIVLCHQAGWSRGEYREIAPKLNELGFNCLALDQRSGGTVNGVDNETVKLAKSQKKKTGFVDAEQDIVAAIDYCRQNHANAKLILWGSSYSSALALRIAGEHPDKIDGVMAFAPGEYFVRFGKPKDWILTSAKKIDDPVFITSAKNEYTRWENIFDAISSEKQKFVPSTNGNHGSRALWKKFPDHGDYWKAVEAYLAKRK